MTWLVRYLMALVVVAMAGVLALVIIACVDHPWPVGVISAITVVAISPVVWLALREGKRVARKPPPVG